MTLFSKPTCIHSHRTRLVLAEKNINIDISNVDGPELPEDLILVPGVLDSTTNFVEHPKLVAERICRFADIVGRERVIAGTDCGFSTFAGFGAVDEDIVYAKLASMADGAAIASDRLWGQASG
jgi:5-methyltetrahydropteroyltriglutamate--homocysteine methyltransferase